MLDGLRKRKFIVFMMTGMVFLVLTAGGYMIHQEDAENEEFVLTVNGAKVSRQEFEAAMLLERVGVIHEFQTTYGAAYQPDLWEQSFNGITPADMLRSRALERIIDVKLQQLAAVQAGIMNESEMSRSSFLTALQKENERRKLAVDRGEIIYGPIQYGEDEYFRYSLNNLVIRLKEKLAEHELAHSPAEIAAYYKDQRLNLYKKPMHIRAQKLVIPAESDAREEARVLAEEARLEADRMNSLEQAAAEKGHQAEFSEQVFNETTERGDQRYSPELLEAVSQLEPGKISGVIPVPGGYAVLQAVERKDGGYYPLSEVQEDVMNRLMDQKYEQWLTGKRETALIKINDKIYNQMALPGGS